jgi:hypothetical protein
LIGVHAPEFIPAQSDLLDAPTLRERFDPARPVERDVLALGLAYPE